MTRIQFRLLASLFLAPALLGAKLPETEVPDAKFPPDGRWTQPLEGGVQHPETEIVVESDRPPAGAGSGRHPEPLGPVSPELFLEAITPPLKTLISVQMRAVAERSLPKEQRGSIPDLQEKRNVARNAFEEAVRANWPYGGEKFAERQQAYADAMHEVLSLSKEALSREMERDEAAREILAIAAGFPESPLYDRAEHLTGDLYWRIKPRQPDQYLVHLGKAANSDAALGPYRVFALTNLASWPSDDLERMNMRREFSKQMNGLRDPDALAKKLAAPLPYEPRSLYLKRVFETITTIESQYATNAVNMTVDAMRTSQPQVNLQQLRDDEKENPYIERYIKQQGLDKPLTEESRPAPSRYWIWLISISLLGVLTALAVARRARRVREPKG